MPARDSLPRSSRGAIVAAARERLGHTFQIGHRTAHSLDCGGLLLSVAQRVRLNWRDLPYKYAVGTSGGLALYGHLRLVMDEIQVEQLAEGSVMLFWIRHADFPQHLAIWTGSQIIHTSPFNKLGVIEQGLTSNYRKRVFAAFDFRPEGAEAQHEVEPHKRVPCIECVQANPMQWRTRKVFLDRDRACYSCEHSAGRL